MIVRKFEGYGWGWNRCDCCLPLTRTSADTRVHLHGQHSVKIHNIIMARKEAAKA